MVSEHNGNTGIGSTSKDDVQDDGASTANVS